MRCIHCGTRARRWRRGDGRCRGCTRRIVFDPANDPFAVTDEDFHGAVLAVSQGDHLFFDVRQLWSQLNRRRRTASAAWKNVPLACLVAGGAAGVALGVLDVVPLPLTALFMIGAAAGIGVALLLRRVAPSLGEPPPPPPTVPYDVFVTRYLKRWVAVHGPLARLLPEPGVHSVLREVPADVAAFSFDRVVVTQHAGTAAMLVANRFHFEHACAVLSLDGYTFGIAETVRAMLRRNPRLTVFAVHDASAAGVALPFTLRDPAWFPATPVVDVGIRSARVGPGARPLLPFRRGRAVKLPAHVRRALGKADAAWIETGNHAELSALRPEEVMQMIQRAFTATGLPGHPQHREATRLAAAGGGVVLADSLPRPRPTPRPRTASDDDDDDEDDGDDADSIDGDSMKCIYCGTDSKKRDRADGRCPRCRHSFAFEPATDSNRVTDPQFKAAIERVSADGSVHFTDRELWYEFNRKWMKPGFWRSPYGWLPVLGVTPALLSAIEVLPFDPFYAWFLGAPVGLFLGAVGSTVANQKSPAPPRPPRIPFPAFQSAYLARWRAAHGDPPRLLPPRDAQLAAPRARGAGGRGGVLVRSRGGDGPLGDGGHAGGQPLSLRAQLRRAEPRRLPATPSRTRSRPCSAATPTSPSSPSTTRPPAAACSPSSCATRRGSRTRPSASWTWGCGRPWRASSACP